MAELHKGLELGPGKTSFSVSLSLSEIDQGTLGEVSKHFSSKPVAGGVGGQMDGQHLCKSPLATL